MKQSGLGHSSCVRPLRQDTPGRLVLVTLQFGVDDGAGSAADGQLLSGLHLVSEVSEPPIWVHLKLLLQGEGDEGGRRRPEREGEGDEGVREETREGGGGQWRRSCLVSFSI